MRAFRVHAATRFVQAPVLARVLVCQVRGESVLPIETIARVTRSVEESSVGRCTAGDADISRVWKDAGSIDTVVSAASTDACAQRSFSNTQRIRSPLGMNRPGRLHV